MFTQKEQIKYSEDEIKRLREVLLHMYLCRMFTEDYMYHHNAIECIKILAKTIGLAENEVLSFVYSHKNMQYTPTKNEKVNALTYLQYPVTKIMKILGMSHAYVKLAHTDEAIQKAMFADKEVMVERFLTYFELIFRRKDLS